MDKNPNHHDVTNLNVPRRAKYVHEAQKKTSRRSILVRHQSCFRKRIDFLSDSIECNYPSWSTSSLFCIPKVVRMETWEVKYEKVCPSLRPLSKFSLKHEWKRELGSEHLQRPEIGQLSTSFNSNQPVLNPSRERTVRPVVKDDTRTDGLFIDFTVTEIRTSQETQNIWLTNWGRNAKTESSKESMTDSYEIMISLAEWLNIFEMKEFVEHGIFLRMKITLTIWQEKRIKIRTNGGFIHISEV